MICLNWSPNWQYMMGTGEKPAVNCIPKTFSSLHVIFIIFNLLVLLVLLLETLMCGSFMFKGTAITNVNCWAASVSAGMLKCNAHYWKYSTHISWYRWLILVVNVCQPFTHLTVLYSTEHFRSFLLLPLKENDYNVSHNFISTAICTRYIYH